MKRRHNIVEEATRVVTAKIFRDDVGAVDALARRSDVKAGQRADETPIPRIATVGNCVDPRSRRLCTLRRCELFTQMASSVKRCHVASFWCKEILIR